MADENTKSTSNMDSAHLHLDCPPPTSTTAHVTPTLHSSISPTPTGRSKRYSEPTPGKQRRLLQSRNAKFPAKKLSLSNIGSKFTQLIHANDERTSAPEVNQENFTPHTFEKPYLKRHASTNSLGILDEISNSTLHRKLRRSENIPIYEDNPERPLLERSPYSSPPAYREISSQDPSPIGFDHIQDNLSIMRLREISGNEYRGSPLAKSSLNGSVKANKKYKSIPIKTGFDTQEYIEHIERELQQARSEMFSPTSNRSLKDQLQNVRNENAKLRQDMTDMRDMYEAVVKKTLEHKAALEVELRRKVRDLEEELEQKESLVRDLEFQHDERRLDNSTIDGLKAALERLEQDKVSLEDENRSMTKRNEVLSELLAMSPSKLQSFELRSPVREKRGAGRPMSMIIPRIPSSPTGRQLSQPVSAVASPSVSICAPFFGTTKSCAGSPQAVVHGLGLMHSGEPGVTGPGSNVLEQGYFVQQELSKPISRRSTMQSQTSINDTVSIVSQSSSPIDQTTHRLPPKRKPRKFMSGSTQLKPLLLPALAGDSMPTSASSVSSSPRIEALRDSSQGSIDPTTFFVSRSGCGFTRDVTECGDTILSQVASDRNSEDVATEYRSFQDLMAEHDTSFVTDPFNSHQSELDNSNESSVGDDTILDPQQALEEWTSSQCALTSGTENHFKNFMDGVTSSHNAHIEMPFNNTKSISSYGVGFDLNALKQLGLPEPEYDELPQENANANETYVTDVPQPLFSLSAHRACLQEQSITSKAIIHPQRSAEPDVALGDQLGPDLADRIDSPLIQSDDLANLDLGATSTVAHDWRISTQHLHSRGSELCSSSSTDLPQRSPMRAAECLTKTKSPLDVLRAGKFGARPLAALTIRTIFGTISQCTGHVRDFKRDPLALARRVLANAWFSNWTRFGRLSWWVLGLFMKSSVGRSTSREWEWGNYDGEEIARRICHESGSISCRTSEAAQSINASTRQVRFQGNDVPTDTNQKIGWRKSLLLWGKFSVAIMLALGGAVVRGPGEMLKDISDSDNSRSGHTLSKTIHNRCHPQTSIATPSSSPDTSCKASHNGRYDRHPTPAKVPQMSSPSTDTSSSPRSSTIDFEDIDDRNGQRAVHTEDEETLRPFRNSRMHVADVFQRNAFSSMKHGQVSNVLMSDPALQSSRDDVNSISSGTVKWPPSPGPILPERNGIFTRRWL